MTIRPLVCGILVLLLGSALRAQPAATLSVTDGSVRLRDVTYLDVDGKRTAATLVAPARTTGATPGVVFAHWYGPEHTTSNRTEFMPDAFALARAGVVSLLIDTPWTDPRWFVARDTGREVAIAEDAVARMRRAIAVLRALEGVDPGRLGYVGHDFGGMFGAVAAAQEGGVRALAFIAGTARMGDWFTLGRSLDAAGRQRVLDRLAHLDPARHIGRAAGAVLLQFGTRDVYVPRPSTEAMVEAAGRLATVAYFDTDHAMDSAAMTARVDWLIHALDAKAEGRE